MRLTEKFPSQVESFDFLSCIKNECNGRMRIRLLALQSLKEGNKIKDICSYLKICRDRINIWASKFLEQGIEGLKELPGRGSKSKISLEEKKEVAKFINAPMSLSEYSWAVMFLSSRRASQSLVFEIRLIFSARF